MKHKKHRMRKSYRKWAMKGQRTRSETSIEHLKRTSVGGKFGRYVSSLA